MSLTDLPLGSRARIERLSLDLAQAAMLRAIGIAEGQSVRVTRRAPFGGPLQVHVGHVSFALDRALAATVVVTPER